MSFSAYSEYKSSGVELFEKVPSRWSIQRLKQVVNPSRPITYGIVQAGENVPDGIPYIRPADMTDESGVKSEDTLLRTSPEIASSYKRSSIVAGDIVCSIGPSFGKLMMVPSSLEGSNLTQGTARVAVSQGNMPRFVFWVLKSVESYQQWESSIGGATFRALNLGPLAETFICVPGPAEQAQIARFLDHETARIDALIDEQQRLIELLKEKRQAVISHAVTKGLDPTVPMKGSGEEWLGEVPAHWVRKRLKNISPFITVGIVVNPSDYVADEGLPFLYGGEVKEGFIEVDKARKISPENSRKNRKTMLEAGDIVTMRVGYPGLTAVVPPECAGGNCASVMLVRRGKYDSHWLCAVMNSRLVRQQVEVVQYGAAQKQFNIADAIEFWMYEPPIEEQSKIAEFIDGQSSVFDALMEESERSMLLLKERRSALISAAVTGKIDVCGWQPPASAPTPELAKEAV